MSSNSRFQGMTSPSSQKNTPTVPMSVYRELAGELQSAHQQIQDLKADNRYVHHENQTLRAEIKKLVQSVQSLEATLNDWDENARPQQTLPLVQQQDTASHTPSTQEHWFSHEQVYYPVEQENQTRNDEINGWFVMAAMVMIIFTFSGLGFMIARPLLDQSGEQ